MAGEGMEREEQTGQVLSEQPGSLSGRATPASREPGSVLGAVSLGFWSLLILVTVKYLVYVMRADNEGEGGFLVLAVLGLAAILRRPGILAEL